MVIGKLNGTQWDLMVIQWDWLGFHGDSMGCSGIFHGIPSGNGHLMKISWGLHGNFIGFNRKINGMRIHLMGYTLWQSNVIKCGNGKSRSAMEVWLGKSSTNGGFSIVGWGWIRWFWGPQFQETPSEWWDACGWKTIHTEKLTTQLHLCKSS